MRQHHPLVKAGHHVALTVGILFCLTFLVSVVVMAAYELAYGGMILPRVLVSGVDISNMNKAAAKRRLEMEFVSNPSSIQLYYRGQTITDANSVSKKYDFDWAAEQAWGLGRGGNPVNKINERVRMFFRPKQIDLPISYDGDALDGMIAKAVGSINQESIPPKIKIDDAGEIRIEPGVDGLMVDEESLQKAVVADLVLPGGHTIEIPTKVDSAAIENTRVNQALEIANKWKGRDLRLFYKVYSLRLTTEEIFKMIGLAQTPVNNDEVNRLLVLVKPMVETEAKNAIFNFDEGKVVEFSPEVVGVKVDEGKLLERLTQTVQDGLISDLEIPVILIEPKIKTGDINSLGIKSLVGVGTSKFAHSIPNRVHNLTLASSRLNGALVAPGETFSLGQTIGDISRTTGYREAYIISEGRTILGDGGGVCQVSTTLFRAILNAGLPIVERKAHAYRVGYYEQDMAPGYDATVFFPSADLKFINDTPGYLLIQTKVDAKNFSMRYEIYGTADGRVATISPAKISSQTPPLATIYQDDPTLPLGTKKQIDWSAPGAKVSFDYKVTRGNEVLQDRTFYSTYQPWAAIYLVGTGQLASN